MELDAILDNLSDEEQIELLELLEEEENYCGVVINSGRSSCSLVEPASLVWRGVW